MGDNIFDIKIDFEDSIPDEISSSTKVPTKLKAKKVGYKSIDIKPRAASVAKKVSKPKLKVKSVTKNTSQKSVKPKQKKVPSDAGSSKKFHTKPERRRSTKLKASVQGTSDDIAVKRLRIKTASAKVLDEVVRNTPLEQKSEVSKAKLKSKPSKLKEVGGYNYGQLNHICNLVRQDILDMLYHAGSGHSAGSLDQVEIFVALYFKIMRHDPSDPMWGERDILVQSNGHTVPVRYAVMARAGYFPRKELLSLRKFDSNLQGHPERERIPALETTSGPLGSGLSQAVGMALSLRSSGNLTRRVYCTMGDGELDEGNIWEAAMFAAKYKLGNLIGIVDRNNIQIDGFAEDVMPLESLREKWEAFGWYVQEVDGNNIESVISVLNLAKSQTVKPSLIIAHTIPGKGVDFMEYDFSWHGKAPNKSQEEEAIRRLRTLDGRIEGGHL